MLREQMSGDLQPLTGSGILPGSVEGTVFRDFQSHFFSAGLTGEYNLLPAVSPVALYVGAGFGCLFATGNTWALKLRNEMRSDNWTNALSVGGHNDAHRYAAPFIPARLSLEVPIVPQVALCLSGDYRFLITKQAIAPKHQVGATLGLRIRLTP